MISETYWVLRYRNHIKNSNKSYKYVVVDGDWTPTVRLKDATLFYTESEAVFTKDMFGDEQASLVIVQKIEIREIVE